MDVGGRPLFVLQPARREAPPSDRSDLFPARHKTGGGGGAAVTFLWRLWPPAHHWAQSARAVFVGALTRKNSTNGSANRGGSSGRGTKKNGGDIRPPWSRQEPPATF